MSEENVLHEWVESYNQMARNLNTTRIWDIAEKLAETYWYQLPKNKQTKEGLLELFKYYLRELMKSE